MKNRKIKHKRKIIRKHKHKMHPWSYGSEAGFGYERCIIKGCKFWKIAD